MSEKICVGTLRPYAGGNEIGSPLFARFELHSAWKANLRNRIIALGKMAVNRTERYLLRVNPTMKW